MTKPYHVDLARDRIGQVFQYLQEMHRVRTPPVLHLAERNFQLPLETLPASSHLRNGWDPTGARTDWREFALKVGRPELTECPEPSVMVKNWLRKGWDDPTVSSDDFLKTSMRVRGKTQQFDESEERVEAFDEWMDRRGRWVEESSDAVSAMRAFSDLFELYSMFERESEKFQLYVGDGILMVEQDGRAIAHPILLQRVQLSFHAGIPEFVVEDTDDNPELYTPLLRHVGIEGSAIQSAKEAVDREHFHPLDGEATSAFFRDFVQRHWKDGRFVEGETAPDASSGEAILVRRPCLFVGDREQGFAESLERFLEVLPTLEDLPESLLRIVGIETGRGATPGQKPVDLLLTKHANLEQERVIQRLEETGAVLVQGPPGTGKSHTIANLIGHLLAQNKSILVTSHASKALRVVREKLPERLQPLCVSVLQDDMESAKQLEESVTGIINTLATTNEKKIEREIEKLSEKRATLKEEFDELHTRLLDAAKEEYEEIEILGESVAPSDAARRLAADSPRHDWLPGPLTSDDLPISEDEVRELYRLQVEIPAEDDDLLACPLPDLDAFPTPQDFAAVYDNLASVQKEKPSSDETLWTLESHSPGELDRLQSELTEAVQILDTEEEWVFACIQACRENGQEFRMWRELVELIENALDEIAEKKPLVVQVGPDIQRSLSLTDARSTCDAILHHLDAGKKLKGLSMFMRKDWVDFVRAVRVGGEAPTSKEHFEAIRNALDLETLRDELCARWDRQMVPLGAPPSADFGAHPENRLREMAVRIREVLRWHADSWMSCETMIEKVGLDWRELCKRAKTKSSAHAEWKAVLEVVRDHLPGPVAERKTYLRWSNLANEKETWSQHLDSFSRKDPAYPLIRQFKTAIRKSNYDSYADTWGRLRELLDLAPKWERRETLLARLQEAAPNWESAIRTRSAPHDGGEAPGDIASAWRHHRVEERLVDRASVDLDKLQARFHRVKDDLFEATSKYVEKLAWIAQLRRTGLPQQQALSGWLGLHKKIGKGTGKNVGQLKEEAKKTLRECRSAVPVWIMPLTRVAESFDLATTRFDVVILDEASQSDVMGLIAFALAKEVVVVGDHEQVSPYAIGQKSEKINALIDEILTDIPNRRLYDGKTSVYDLARQSFGGTIRLLEHFRCVPDIIQFSNQLCYGGEIRALRDASSSAVKQPLVAHRVSEGDERNGVNENEALEIVSLVSAICRLPEYDQSTIGVISMVGTDQALYIDSVLRRRLTVSEYKKRQILCGNASQFQGDERDIIFLSMVNSPSDRPLSLRQREDARKVFNVAASRARDQLWVVHSLDPRRDLKPGDLRLQLITHAENPAGLRPKSAKPKTKFNTDFEAEIAGQLREAGYQVTPNWEVGDCVIDLVVEGKGGRRIAVPCDGDRMEAVEVVVETLERQFTLERLGWDFLRLRASEYYRDPEGALKRLRRRLKTAGVEPFPPSSSEVEATPQSESTSGPDALTVKVVKRAELIRQRWKGIPAASEIISEAEPAAAPAPESASPSLSEAPEDSTPSTDEP